MHLTGRITASVSQQLGRVVANVLDCYYVVSEFELHPRYYMKFWTNILEQDMNYLLSSS